MAIIDVNLQKPALKRETESDDSEESTMQTEEMEAETASGGGRSMLKTGGVIVAGIIGLLTVRRIRKRRSNRE